MSDGDNLKRVKEIREEIDRIDLDILRLFRDRDRRVEEIVRYKTDREGVIANKRQKEVLAQRRAWAESLNLDPDLFERIYKMLIKSNIEKELRLFGKSGINKTA
jgi:chorismate mutase